MFCRVNHSIIKVQEEKGLMEKITLQESGKVKQPTEEEWFYVNPKFINRQLFEEKRDNENEESARILILKAFSEVDKNPDEYGRPFETFIPIKTWEERKTPIELMEMAKTIGNCTVNWVRFALKTAQRIQNGETWKDVCVNGDYMKCYRLIRWDDNHYTVVGGSCKSLIHFSSTNILIKNCRTFEKLSNTVPEIGRYAE